MNLGVASSLFFCTVFLLVVFLNRLRLNRRSIYIFSIWGVYAVTVISVFLMSDQKLDSKITAASLIYSLLSVLIVTFLPEENRMDMVKALFYAILILLFLILLQYLVYFVFYRYLDLHNFVTLGRYVSRYESNYLAQFGILRPTGLSVEPSNYSAVLMYMTLSYAWLKGRLDNTVILLLFFSSLTLSFASMGIVGAVIAVIGLARLLENKRVFDLAIVIIVFFLALVAGQILFD
ncbi:MAG: hypothetical protein VW258_11840, partial [Thalassolituus sp.]